MSGKETTVLTCRCGVRSPEHARSGSVGEIERVTGFCPVCDVSNGLTFIWLCPACFEKVAAAWATIVGLVGHDMISMVGVMRRRERAAQASR